MPLVEYSETDGVAHVRLNRPAVANALDLRTARAFRAVVDQASDDQHVRAVLVSGAGARFCAGGDVASFVAAEDQARYIHQLATELDQAFQALADLTKPVVTAVHGAVAGAGLGLMLSADVTVAAPDTKFVFAYPGIGFTPDCGVSWLLPRAVGLPRAMAFALTGQVLQAEQACDWGLVAMIEQDPLGAATELAEACAKGPAAALGQTRRLLRAGLVTDRASAGVEEANTISKAVLGEEAQLLISQFVNRRA
ncbi:enoyl-CoA hydratase/isomerase family protein [uncultured Serinicoccus sp.]|uniref:enoyl-CoA hydratase/isomerase family protein n=1 Tax=uncultured Serinicoccus sp. TaxID=735514 RepID=UPI00262F2579|nr:enoyl-CoA hydratase/isomerase family protein [uncultured Serinicoccus sp.]